MRNRMDDALVVLGLVAEYDQRFTGLEEAEAQARAQAWAVQLEGTNLDVEWLLKGVQRAYGGVERPANPVGMIIAEAKMARRIGQQGEAVGELSAGGKGRPHGLHAPPIDAAYEVDGAIGLDCPQCKAGPGEVCEDGDKVCCIPHTPRLVRAFRENNPRGRARAAERVRIESPEAVRERERKYGAGRLRKKI